MLRILLLLLLSILASGWPADAGSQTPVSGTLVKGANVVGLDESIRLALQTNPTVASARERFRAVQGSLRTARTWANPTLTYQVENASFPGGSAPAALERETSAFAMLPLESLYQRGPRIARADAEVRSAESAFGEARRAVVLTTAAAFFRTASAQVAVESALDVRRWLDSLVAYTETRVREGAAAEADLIRLEVEQGRADVDLAMATIDLTRASADISLLTGLDSASVRIPSDSAFAATSSELEPLTTLVARALLIRPDVIGARARVTAATLGVAVERRAIIREIGAMGGVKSMEGVKSFMAGVSLPLPLFDRNAGEIQRADAERHIAILDQQLIERTVASEVAIAYKSLRSLTALRVQNGDNLLFRARDSRRIAEAAYREGAVPLSQVIEASRALADATESHYRALFTWMQIAIELDAAAGLDRFTGVR